METKELKIIIPENHEIDWQESAKQEKIVFKKIDNKPRSWKEYLELNTGFDGSGIDWNMSGGIQATGLHHRGKAIVPTNLAAPFIAMMQLMSLRQSWIKGWNSNLLGYAIMLDVKRDIMVSHDIYHRALTFPDRNMAVDFMNCFKDLLEIAKPLL